MDKVFRAVALTLLALAFASLAAIYPVLPDRVASHFDARGNPNGWMTKTGFCVFMVLLSSGLSGLMLVLLPWVNGKVPDALVNVPQKPYWFATPERKALLHTRIRAMLACMNLYTGVVVLISIQIVYQENVPAPLYRVPIGTLLLAMLPLTLVWILGMFRFMKPPE